MTTLSSAARPESIRGTDDASPGSSVARAAASPLEPPAPASARGASGAASALGPGGSPAWAAWAALAADHIDRGVENGSPKTVFEWEAV